MKKTRNGSEITLGKITNKPPNKPPMENKAQEQLIAIINQLKDFKTQYFPEQHSIELNCCTYGETFRVHRAADHAEALRMKRLLGVGDASKLVFDASNPWHCLEGKLENGAEVKLFATGLPPSCRIETYEEEIPKTQLVDLPETVKVKRTRICCGGEK